MKYAIKIVFKGFNYLISVAAGLMFLSVLLFYTLWISGVVEKRWPLIYCAMSKRPEDRFIQQSDTIISLIRYTNGCNCDTSYYIKTNITHATIQRP